MNENLIKTHMEALGISRDEAISLIQEDERIDRMTSSKQIDSDLTEEQKKASKANRQADRKPTTYKFDTSKRKKKENADKQALIEALRSALEDTGSQNIEVTNIEREISFEFNDVNYKLVLSCPRK